jgi:hypothetical protein
MWPEQIDGTAISADVRRTQARKLFVGLAGRRPLLSGGSRTYMAGGVAAVAKVQVVSQPWIGLSVFPVLCEPVLAAEMSPGQPW